MGLGRFLLCFVGWGSLAFAAEGYGIRKHYEYTKLIFVYSCLFVFRSAIMNLRAFKKSFGYFILLLLGGAAVFIWLAVFGREAPKNVKVSFFDIGQGSAVFVAAPNHNQVLIDGGPSGAILAKLGSALPLFDREIELLILTHPDLDHIAGLVEIVKRYKVSRVLETGISDSSPVYQEWHKLLQAKGIPIVFARAGQIIKVADNLAIKILYPLAKINGQSFAKTNETSVVTKVAYGRNAFLLTGDAEGAAESSLIFGGADLKTNVLQVAHHGSKNSTGVDFLNKVKPAAAVIQVGAKNKYGHPHPETLERLARVKAKILRNDLLGDIIFECDLNICRANH